MKTPILILPRPLGGLGNRLILASHVMAFAHEYGLEVFNLALCEYAHFFKGSSRDIFSRYPLKPFPVSVPGIRKVLSKIALALGKLVRLSTGRQNWAMEILFPVIGGADYELNEATFHTAVRHCSGSVTGLLRPLRDLAMTALSHCLGGRRPSRVIARSEATKQSH